MDRAGAGVKVVQFREVPMDLEDAFLSVTANTAGGSGDRPEPATSDPVEADHTQPTTA